LNNYKESYALNKQEKVNVVNNQTTVILR